METTTIDTVLIEDAHGSSILNSRITFQPPGCRSIDDDGDIDIEVVGRSFTFTTGLSRWTRIPCFTMTMREDNQDKAESFHYPARCLHSLRPNGFISARYASHHPNDHCALAARTDFFVQTIPAILIPRWHHFSPAPKVALLWTDLANSSIAPGSLTISPSKMHLLRITASIVSCLSRLI
jgi:hypothetical protein